MIKLVSIQHLYFFHFSPTRWYFFRKNKKKLGRLSHYRAKFPEQIWFRNGLSPLLARPKAKISRIHRREGNLHAGNCSRDERGVRVHLNSRIKPEAERLRKHETFDVGFTGCLRSGGGGGGRRKPAKTGGVTRAPHSPPTTQRLPIWEDRFIHLWISPPPPPFSPSKSNYRCANSWLGTVITRIISRDSPFSMPVSTLRENFDDAQVGSNNRN